MINDGNKSKDEYRVRVVAAPAGTAGGAECAFAAPFMDASPGKFLPYSILCQLLPSVHRVFYAAPEITIHDYAALLLRLETIK